MARGAGVTGAVVLVSYHYLGSKRKAGFHFLAEAYHRLGWEVTFVTAPISWISYLARDPRFAYPIRDEARRLRERDGRLRSFVLMTRFHPANLRIGLANRLAAPLWARYARAPLGELEGVVRTADLFLFESTPALLLAERFRALNPRARYVYRVSDDMRALGFHPVALEGEQRLAAAFDLVSTPSRTLFARFAHLPQARLDGHALEARVFDEADESPYSTGRNALFLGFWPIDEHFFSTAASAFPDVAFHVIGQRTALRAPNVVEHGELPFAETVPFVRHASFGLNAVAYRPGLEALSDSLKVIQFSYCGLPIVAPAFIAGDRPNVIAYEPGNTDSVREAVDAALRAPRRPELRREIPSWDELAAKLAA